MGAVALVAVTATVTTAVAAALDEDGVHLRGDFTEGGHAWLELDDRNVAPAICFVWDSDRPQDGDAITSHILTHDGTEIAFLGIGDQWVDGTASGCEVMRDDDFQEVFDDPDEYVVEVRIVENQGTPVTPALRTGPLRAESS